MGMVKRFDVYLVNLDPTVGHEIKKSRPCLVISPDEMNRYISTAIVAPMTTKGRNYPTRVPCTFQGKEGQVVMDQIRTVDKNRLIPPPARSQWSGSSSRRTGSGSGRGSR